MNDEQLKILAKKVKDGTATKKEKLDFLKEMNSITTNLTALLSKAKDAGSLNKIRKDLK